MRILQLHCDSIEYTPTKKEIKSAEDIDNPQTQKLEELVVVFVAMEDGDDSSVAQDAISQIKNSMEKIGCKKLLLYPYAHLSSNLAKPSVAIALLKEMESSASDLEVSHSPFGWTKSYKLQVKGHPLAESSKVVTKDTKKTTADSELTSDALEGESKIRSIWKIMSPDGTLSNIADFASSIFCLISVFHRLSLTKRTECSTYSSSSDATQSVTFIFV